MEEGKGGGKTWERVEEERSEELRWAGVKEVGEELEKGGRKEGGCIDGASVGRRFGGVRGGEEEMRLRGGRGCWDRSMVILSTIEAVCMDVKRGVVDVIGLMLLSLPHSCCCS